MKRPPLARQNWYLAFAEGAASLFAVIALAIIPLIFVRGEYEGADGQAESAIAEISPTYEPWFQPLFEPASGEIESLLFASQAAIGAGVIGYVIGLSKGRNQKSK